MAFPFLLLNASENSQQYRKSMPSVVGQQQTAIREEPVFDSSQFIAKYSQAGKPTLMIFWNRVVSDEFRSTDFVPGAVSVSDVVGDEIRRGFRSELLKHGVRLASRRFSLRKVAAKVGEWRSSVNGQLLEVTAVSDYAQKILEVLFVDWITDGGPVFELSMIDTEAARIELNFQNTEIPTYRKIGETVQASSTGYEFLPLELNVPNLQIGARLAQQFMERY
jgi:hypothetical protein